MILVHHHKQQIMANGCNHSRNPSVCDTAFEQLLATNSTLSAIVAGATLCEEVCPAVGWGEKPGSDIYFNISVHQTVFVYMFMIHKFKNVFQTPLGKQH